MGLQSGARLGPYEIVSPLGAGGMGEVYRARDARLGRDVALKVLPEQFSRDPERMARFAREAQVLASLNHPNIAAIYGLEESDGRRALVMELVEGPTLAERLAASHHPLTPSSGRRGIATSSPPGSGGGQGVVEPATMPPSPLQIDEALSIAKQIAEGLEAAHECGIIHRDLKPANVKITSQGTVKLLDFGLAKALDTSFAASVGTPLLEDSPTLSAMATQAGIILGTAAYMSPEQARGKPVDRRADIWAFGCVLFEMLAGRQGFEGETVSDTLASVLKTEPNWGALPEATPPAIQKLVRRCLTKDPRKRLRDIGEARITIEAVLSGGDEAPPLSPLLSEEGKREARGGKPWRRVLPWAVAAAAVIAAVLFALGYIRLARAPAERMISQINPPEKTAFVFSVSVGGPAEISPDGRRLAFVASAPDKTALWVQQLDQTSAQVLPGTEGASYPFWSPDSRFLGFFAGGKLKKIDVSGGPPITLCDAPVGRGGAWNQDGIIVFAPNISGPLESVAAAGGIPKPATAMDPSQPAVNHRWPEFLPDGRHFIYFSWNAEGTGGTYVTSLGGESPKLLVPGDSNAVFAPPNHLLFVRDRTLMAQRFDPASEQLSGEPVPVAEHIEVVPQVFGSAISASANGILAYQVGEASGVSELVWFDRNGKRLSAVGGPADYLAPRISPDGKRLAVSIMDPGSHKYDVWILDLARGSRTRLTFSPADNINPIWSPDGHDIAFTSSRKGGLHTYRKRADGTGSSEPLLENANTLEFAYSWSSDGKYLAYRRASAGTKGQDIWALPLFGDRKPFPVVQNGFPNIFPAFSPNVKWLAYTSPESGHNEVYAVPFPRSSGKWMVSMQGGTRPLWRHDGREIFYVSADNKIMAADVKESGASLEIGTAHPLFQPPMGAANSYAYDVSADGKRFIIAAGSAQASSQPVTLVVNWAAGLKN